MAKAKSAGIIFFAGDRVLLMKRDSLAPEGGSWDFPGGGMEPGETPKEAARRETREESGFDYDGPLLKVKKMSNGYVAFAALLDEPFVPVLNDEHTEYVWATFDDLPTPLHSVTRKELKELDDMPLVEGKSDKARSENIKKEIEAGKDPKQAAAIAYSVQRKAGGKDRAYDAQQGAAAPTSKPSTAQKVGRAVGHVAAHVGKGIEEGAELAADEEHKGMLEGLRKIAADWMGAYDSQFKQQPKIGKDKKGKRK